MWKDQKGKADNKTYTNAYAQHNKTENRDGKCERNKKKILPEQNCLNLH